MGIFSSIKDKITRYIEVNIKLFKLDFIGRTANLMSFFMFALICLFMFCCILLFVGFGLTQVFVNAGASPVGAYFLTTGVYLLLLVVIILLRGSVTRILASAFIDVLTGNDKVDIENEEKENTPKT